MRRILIAVGVVVALSGALVCWPLARILLTHERGYARILEIYREERPDGEVALHAAWELEVAPGRWLIGDAQRNQFFQPIDDPTLATDEVNAVTTRVLPDRQNRQTMVKAFWKANDPGATAFILDVSKTHPWRRYIIGLAACTAGLICSRLAWSSGNRRTRR